VSLAGQSVVSRYKLRRLMCALDEKQQRVLELTE
jgi:hypothetical protein